MPATITKISQIPLPDTSGKMVPYIVVEFKVGDHGPFSESFPKSSYNAEVAKQAVNAFAITIEQTHR